MKTIGYARVSTAEQKAGLEAQIRELTAAGCDKIYKEQVSSVAERIELERAIEWLREDDHDVFVVTKLDRFARSLDHAIELEKRIAAKGATLKILNSGIDTSTPTGRLMFGMLAAVAQFEREIMLERQREGIKKAKVEGKYRGRAPTARQQSATVLDLHAQGVGPREIVKRLAAVGQKISRASVHRILADAKASAGQKGAANS
jgi:DNA invertase Pin-like site-specific DNA recombinase